MKICTVCPHQNDCLNTGACLAELNAPRIAANQFPQRMTPAQANRFMEALRAGQTQRNLRPGNLARLSRRSQRFHKHCELYPEWGTEGRRLTTVNRQASDKLKGIGAGRSGETHCRNGHPYAIYGTFKAKTGPKYAHMKGRLFRYCKACNVSSGRKLVEPLPSATIDKIKDLLRHGKAPHSFAAWRAPGRLCKFYVFKQLCEHVSEVNNLAALSLERRKLLHSPSKIISIPKPAIITVTNLRTPTLTGCVAGGADVVFSAVNEAVSLRLPRHIRDDVMGQLFLDVEEGHVALSDVKQFARKYVSDLYQEERRGISLDAPAPITSKAQPAAAGCPRQAAEAVKTWARRIRPVGPIPEFTQSLAIIWGFYPLVTSWMGMGIKVMTRAGLLTLVGLFVSACANSGHHASRSATRAGAPWAQDLNEPPPRREPANQAVPPIKADLDAARERASR